MITEVRPFRLRLRRPLVTGAGTHATRAGVLLGVGDGTHTGWGEATPMPGWSTDDLDATAAAVYVAARELDEIDAPDTVAVAELLARLESSAHARAAVAGALYDLRARRAGVPLAQLLAGDRAAAGRVAVNALAHGRDADDVAAECTGAVAAGFDAVKLKVGASSTPVDADTMIEPTTDDISRVVAARRTLGAGRSLRLDANGAWTVDEAIARLQRVAELDLDVGWCEEPVAGIDSIARVGAAAPVAVAIDESARTVADVERALATGSIGVVVVKPQAIGGPDVALAAIERVVAAGAVAVVTSFIDGAVGVAHALHVAAASESTVAHGLATSELLASDLAEPVPVVDGQMSVPDRPGIGVRPT